MPNETVPPRSSRTLTAASRARSIPPTAPSASGRNASPASVSTRPRDVRTKRSTPSSASSRRICSDSDGWRRCKASAAPEIVPWRAAARKYWSCWTVIGAYLWIGKTGRAYSFGPRTPSFHVMTFILLILGLAVIGAPHFGRETRPEWLETPRDGLSV